MSQPEDVTPSPLDTTIKSEDTQEIIDIQEENNEQETILPTVTPIPKLAMIMISLIIISEAVGFSILYPVMPFMARDFLLFEQQQNGLTNGTSSSQNFTNFQISLWTTLTILDSSIYNETLIGNNTNHLDNFDIHEERVGLLVGILASSYSFAQLVSNWFISRASDHLGRKPFLLFGLIVNVILLTLFSFSKNFWFALMVRTLNGAFNANIPIYHSFVVDITDDSNQEKAFVFVSMLWAVSNVVSPGLGGWLAKPAEKWPFIFGGKETWLYNFFNTNPYVLPISIPILMNVFSFILCSIMMKESLTNRFNILKWLLEKFRIRRSQEEKDGNLPINHELISSSNLEDSTSNLLEEEKFSAKLSNSPTLEENCKESNKSHTSFIYLLKDSLVVRVCILYLFLGFAINIMDEMVPIFASNSLQKRGLGLDSSSIGIMLSIGGLTSLITLIIFPFISKKFGFLNLYRIGIVIFVIIISILPFTAELAKLGVDPWIVFTVATFCVFIKACSQELAYTSQFLLVNNSAPSPDHVGSTNGLAHIAASIGWASGPLIGGLLFNAGLNWADSVEKSYPNSWISQFPLIDKITFWLCGGVCILTLILSFTIPKSILNRRYENTH